MELGWLCGLLAVLVFVTLVGHGIWVLVVAMFGRKRPHRLVSAHPATGDAVDDLARVAIEAHKLFQDNLIDATTYQRFIEALQIARARRGTRATPPPLPVLPVIPRTGEALVAQPAAQPSVQAPTPAVASTQFPPQSQMLPSSPPQRTPPAPPPLRPPRIVIPPPPPKVRAPRRPLSDVFAAFMHDSNIRWGELVGGILIVGGSIALVVSFWTQIAHHSFLQFGIFTGVTAAMLGLGLYAEHRWKLPTTSRGILLIATLLIPLNFLAFAALSHGARPTLVETGIELFALALFGFLTWRAAAVLAPYWPQLLTAGILGLSASLAIVQHVGPSRAPARVMALAAIPLAVYAGTIGAMLARTLRWRHLRGHVIDAIYLLLGVLTFGAAASMGLVIFQADSAWEAARALAPLLSLTATPPLAVGLVVWRRVQSPKLAGARTAGTAIAVAAAFLMLGAIALAWPDPASMLPLAAADFVVLTVIALVFSIPAAHALAAGCLLVAYLVAFHVARGNLAWRAAAHETSRALLSAAGAMALVPLFAVVAAATACFRRWHRSADARIYRWITFAIASISIVLASREGFALTGDPYGATWIYLIYAASAYVVAWRLRREEAAWAGCLLLLAGSAQFFSTRTHVAFPWSTGLLAGASVEALAAIALARLPAIRALVATPLKWTATLAAAAAAMLLVPDASMPAAQTMGLHLTWTAAIWFAVALAESSEPIFIAAQVALAAALAVLAVARTQSRPWFGESQIPLLHPWTLQTIGLALAGLPLAASILRLALPVRIGVSRWLRSPWSFDRALLLTLAAAFAVAIGVAEFQAVQIEFGVRGARAALGAWPAHMLAGGSWILLGALLVTVTAWIVDRSESLAPLLWLALAVLICPLLSAHSAGAGAAASALRWYLAGFLLIASLLLWLRGRAPLARILRPAIVTDARVLLVALCAIPIIGLSVYPTALTLYGFHVVGPSADSLFGRIGNSVSYVVPLAVVALAFIGNALRERSGGWSFAASGVCNLTATLGYALAVATGGQPWDAAHCIRLVQINVIVLAGFALAWLALRRLVYRQWSSGEAPAASLHPGPLPGAAGAMPPAPALLVTQIVVALVLVAALLSAPAALLLLAPGYARNLEAIGGPVGWVAVAAAFAALAWLLRRVSASVIASAGIAASLMIACSAAPWDTGNWVSFHVLMSALLAVVSALPVVGFWVGPRAMPISVSVATPSAASPVTAGSDEPLPLQYQRDDSASGAPNALTVPSSIAPAYLAWAGLLSGWIVLLATRAMLNDPQRPWWSAGSTLLLSLLWSTVACRLVAPRLLYVGGALLNLAATMWWLERPWVIGPNPMMDLLAVNGAVVAIGGLAALVLHFQVFRRTPTSQSLLPPFHRVASGMATLAVVACAACGASAAAFGSPSPATAAVAPAAVWFAIVAAAGLALATLADAEAIVAPPQLYVIGLAAVVIGVDELHIVGARISWAYEIALAAFVLVSCALYASRGVIARSLHTLGFPLERRGSIAPWLGWANTILAVAVLYLAGGIDFAMPETWLRITAATAGLAQLMGFVLLARDDARRDLRHATILLATAGAVLWSWAWIPATNVQPLDRAAVAMLALFAAALLCCVEVMMRPDGDAVADASPWPRAARSMNPVLAGLWAVSVVAIIGIEMSQRFGGGSIHMHGAAALVTLVALPLAATLCVLFALRQRPDPFGVPASLRSAYVYAAEVLLAITFLHLRLTMPWLFGGMLAQYWPLLIMALAFAGVAVGELLRRREVLVVSAPLLRTGVFLPLLPVLAFWLAPSRVEFSNLLFVVGFFYAVLSAARRSFGLGVVAAMAANGGLWSLLYHQPELRFLVHPQVWLIPAALSVLIAAQLNRDRLPPPQLRFIRYACLMVVYVASTADIFLNGVREHPLLPLVLVALSIGGVLAGMLFRIRAFLFLGTAFLGIAVVSVIYYAAAGRAWLWYVALVALGVAIFILFTIFEKRRPQMLALVEGLKDWQ